MSKNLPIIACVAALIIACGVAQNTEPTEPESVLSSLVSRSDWRAETANFKHQKSPQIVPQKDDEVKYITIHNFGSPRDQEGTRMRSNQRMHMKKGYGDIAYHYVVGDSGGVYEGRSRSFAPASYTYYLDEDQVSKEVVGSEKGKISVGREFRKWTAEKIPGNTKGHVTVSFMCGGRIEKGELVSHAEVLADDAMNRAAVLIAELLVAYDLNPSAVRAHREFAETDCPNDKVYEWLRGPEMKPDGRGQGMRLIEAAYARLRD